MSEDSVLASWRLRIPVYYLLQIMEMVSQKYCLQRFWYCIRSYPWRAVPAANAAGSHTGLGCKSVVIFISALTRFVTQSKRAVVSIAAPEGGVCLGGSANYGRYRKTGWLPTCHSCASQFRRVLFLVLPHKSPYSWAETTHTYHSTVKKNIFR